MAPTTRARSKKIAEGQPKLGTPPMPQPKKTTHRRATELKKAEIYQQGVAVAKTISNLKASRSDLKYEKKKLAVAIKNTMNGDKYRYIVKSYEQLELEKDKVSALEESIMKAKEQIEQEKSKLVRIAHEYSGIVCKAFCETMYARMPRELRDMVCEHLHDFAKDRHIVIYSPSKTPSGPFPFAVGKKKAKDLDDEDDDNASMMYAADSLSLYANSLDSGSNSDLDYEDYPKQPEDILSALFSTVSQLKQVPLPIFYDPEEKPRSGTGSSEGPYYLDPLIVGADVAREATEALYRKASFIIRHDALLRRVLNEDRWQRGILPSTLLSRIEIVVPEDDYSTSARQAQLHQHFALLRQLTNAKATITVITHMDHWQKLFGHIDEQRDVSWDERHKLRAGAENASLRSIWEAILPTLMEMKEKGATIELEDPCSLWYWTVDRKNMSFEAAWTARRTWRKAIADKQTMRAIYLDAEETAELLAERREIVD